MRTFKIQSNNYPDIIVTGWLVATKVGVYHILQVVRTEERMFVVQLVCDYGDASIQLAWRFRSKSRLCERLRPFVTGNRIVWAIKCQAGRLSLDSAKVLADLRKTVNGVLCEFADVEG